MRTFLLTIALLLSTQVFAKSTCFGTTSAGRLENGCKLPLSGSNFQSYSSVLSLAGRTYVHCDVKNVLLEAYDALHSDGADWLDVYGETGKKNGGKFKPHKTHQNGLSVDFMVPVLNAKKNNQLHCPLVRSTNMVTTSTLLSMLSIRILTWIMRLWPPT